ncbi:MAG: hypothetical protein NVS3B20_12630 [Polyangiales bacterium]
MQFRTCCSGFARIGSLSLLGLMVSVTTSVAAAGSIADENAKPGITGTWTPDNDGTAHATGVVDVYPARWSIAKGESVRLKVHSTTGYEVRVFRLGWYGGAGAREVKAITGLPASPQAFPTPDATYGLAEAKWDDKVMVPTDATWTPGLYVARVTQTSGKQGVTPFVVRDDGATPRAPILFVINTATHQAYNSWPGKARGGKSLYDFNSSAVVPTESDSGSTQAVKVSFDRPFGDYGGMADVGTYEYPYLRFLEKNGWDVAYCTDQDLHATPSIALGRKVVTTAGHPEYWSRPMFDAALAARDAGTNFLFLTGDTISWQVRFEAGTGGATSTLVGYKESWPVDPEQKAAVAAEAVPDIPLAKSHFKLVTRGWKKLEYDPARGIDERRSGMVLSGVASSGIIRDAAGKTKDNYPWADLVITNPTHWLFAGTGLKANDKIANVMGYEVDSLLLGAAEYDVFRPAGQTLLGNINQVADGVTKGSAGAYKHSSGAEVVSLGGIAFSWALDDFAAKATGASGSVDPRAQSMVRNALTRWTTTSSMPDAGAPDSTAETGPFSDAQNDALSGESGSDGANVSDAVNPSIDGPMADARGLDDANGDTSVETSGSKAGCGCRFGERSSATGGWAVLMLYALVALTRKAVMRKNGRRCAGSEVRA